MTNITIENLIRLYKNRPKAFLKKAYNKETLLAHMDLLIQELEALRIQDNTNVMECNNDGN